MCNFHYHNANCPYNLCSIANECLPISPVQQNALNIEEMTTMRLIFVSTVFVLLGHHQVSSLNFVVLCESGRLRAGEAVISKIGSVLPEATALIMDHIEPIYANIVSKFGFVDSLTLEETRCCINRFLTSCVPSVFTPDFLAGVAKIITSNITEIEKATKPPCEHLGYPPGALKKLPSQHPTVNLLSVDYMTSWVSRLTSLAAVVRETHSNVLDHVGHLDMDVLNEGVRVNLNRIKAKIYECMHSLITDLLGKILKSVEVKLYLRLKGAMDRINCNVPNLPILKSKCLNIGFALDKIESEFIQKVEEFTTCLDRKAHIISDVSEITNILKLCPKT